MYRGVLAFDLLSSIIATAEQRINEFEKERRTQKKFYSILTECVQNLYYHVEKTEVDESITNCEAGSVLILISAKKRYYSLITCNNIPNDQVEGISQKIEHINSISQDELKSLYREALMNNQFSDKNTAGLGLMEIARKTDYKFEYGFQKLNEDYSYFSFEIRLARGEANTSQKPERERTSKVELTESLV